MKPVITFLTATGIYPLSLGGPAVHLGYLYSKMKEIGIASDVFDFSNLRSFKRTLRRFFDATRHLATGNIIIFNSPPIRLLFLMSCLSKMLGKRTIFICHGGIFFEVEGLLNVIDRATLLFQLRTGIIGYTVVPSRWLAKFIDQHKIKSKVLVIPNAVDLKEIDSYPIARLATKSNILFLGRLAKIKGITTLMDAFSLLTNANYGYNLYIIGPKGDLSQNEIDKMKNIPCVYLLGRVSHERKFALIKAVDMVVVPSLWENFPIVVLEAMSCGKPVIATKVGGIPEVIEDGYNGILVPKQDGGALAKAISLLMQNPFEAKKLGEAAYRTVKERFTIDIMRQNYLKIIKNS